jgi:hypothetical protein
MFSWLVMIFMVGVMFSPVAPAIDGSAQTSIVEVGDIHGTIHYDVMVLDGLDTNRVRSSLLYVPNWIEFTIVPIDKSQYVVETNGEWVGFKYPIRDNLIVVFDGDNGFKYAGGALISEGNGHRIGVAMYDRDSNYDLGMRIFHEALHTVELGRSADAMMTEPAFYTWSLQPLREHSIQWERLYYDYLMVKFRGERV